MPQAAILLDTPQTQPGTGFVKPIAELSAVMPAYNEESVLPYALAEAVEALDEQCELWELIVVDDGSTDRTPAILRDWSRHDPRVRVVTQETNSGYSRALARGFDSCSYDSIFYTDADAQFDLRAIAELYPHLKQVDMVAGYRVDRQDGAGRRFAAAVYNRLQGLLLGVKVRDVNCAFKLFRRSFFDKVRLTSDGFLVDAELWARAKREGLTWQQVGVTHQPRVHGSSTIRISAISETLRELWALRRALRRGH
jgi:dolichol-phosphate mannosyltransferase